VTHGRPTSAAGSPEVRRIADELVAAGQQVIVLGDLNKGSPRTANPRTNLTALFDPAGPLVSCYDLERRRRTRPPTTRR
jgi:hypothetical protein